MMAMTISSGTFFDSVIELYSECPTSTNDACVAFNDDDEPHQAFASSLEWDSEAGADYWLFIRGYETASGLYTLHIVDTLPPANSKCVGAVDISLNQTIIGYTTFAEVSNASCGEALDRGVWYKTRVNQSGSIILSTCDAATNFETEIEVYEQCDEQSAFGCVVQSSGYKCTPGESRTFPVNADQDYYIFVGSNRTDVNISGLFNLRYTFRPSAPNTSSTSSTTGGNSDISSSSSSVYVDHALEIVEVFLIVFGFLWLASIIFAVACCFYKKHPAKYVQMDAPAAFETEQQASGYVPPAAVSADSQVSMSEL